MGNRREDGSSLAEVPLSITDVAAATKTCKIFGKLYRAVKTGKLDSKDKDLSKFQGVFDSLYIDNDVIGYFSHSNDM